MPREVPYVEYHGQLARLLLFVVLSATLLLGCAGSEGLLQARLPEDPPPPPTSASSVKRLVDKVITAGASAARTGEFTLTVTEEEATSFLNVGTVLLDQLEALPVEDLDQIQDVPELEGIDLGQWQELLEQRERVPEVSDDGILLRPTIEDSAVYFLGNGHVIVRGNARFSIVSVPFRAVAAPRASQGELVLDFVEGRLGPMPMPEILFDYLGRALARAFLAGRDYAEISEITVTDGVMTVSGRWSP